MPCTLETVCTYRRRNYVARIVRKEAEPGQCPSYLPLHESRFPCSLLLAPLAGASFFLLHDMSVYAVDTTLYRVGNLTR